MNMEHSNSFRVAGKLINVHNVCCGTNLCTTVKISHATEIQEKIVRPATLYELNIRDLRKPLIFPEMNTKLRLFITEACIRNCPKCCNKQFKAADIQVVKHFNYEEIMITGGEPFLFPFDVRVMIDAIKKGNQILGHQIPKFYIYTAPFGQKLDRIRLHQLLFADGFTITLHEQSEVDKFLFFAKFLKQMGYVNSLSLRLNLHDGINIPETADLSNWTIKRIFWQEECPIPSGEDFRRISKLLVQ